MIEENFFRIRFKKSEYETMIKSGRGYIAQLKHIELPAVPSYTYIKVDLALVYAILHQRGNLNIVLHMKHYESSPPVYDVITMDGLEVCTNSEWGNLVAGCWMYDRLIKCVNPMIVFVNRSRVRSKNMSKL